MCVKVSGAQRCFVAHLLSLESGPASWLHRQLPDMPSGDPAPPPPPQIITILRNVTRSRRVISVKLGAVITIKSEIITERVSPPEET